MYLKCSQEPFEIFQERKDVTISPDWLERLEQLGGEVTFFIYHPPRVIFKSVNCLKELTRFWAGERNSGYQPDLVLLRFTTSSVLLNDDAKLKANPLASTILRHQYILIGAN